MAFTGQRGLFVRSVNLKSPYPTWVSSEFWLARFIARAFRFVRTMVIRHYHLSTVRTEHNFKWFATFSWVVLDTFLQNQIILKEASTDFCESFSCLPSFFLLFLNFFPRHFRSPVSHPTWVKSDFWLAPCKKNLVEVWILNFSGPREVWTPSIQDGGRVREISGFQKCFGLGRYPQWSWIQDSLLKDAYSSLRTEPRRWVCCGDHQNSLRQGTKQISADARGKQKISIVLFSCLVFVFLSDVFFNKWSTLCAFLYPSCRLPMSISTSMARNLNFMSSHTF